MESRAIIDISRNKEVLQKPTVNQPPVDVNIASWQCALLNTESTKLNDCLNDCGSCVKYIHSCGPGFESKRVSFFNLFRCVFSFSATLAKSWKVQFRLGFANIQKC